MGRRTVKYVDVWNDYNNGSGNCCLSLFTFGTGIDTITGNTTYTYQIVYKTDTGYSHPNYMYRYEYGASGYIREAGLHSTGRRTHLGDGWYHAWGTVTLHPDTTYINTYLFHYEYATQNRVQVAGVMFSEGAEIIPPSQFLEIEETRSNVQGLLDLTGNSTIDLTNAAFNSEGLLTFDGTDDTITIAPRKQYAITEAWTTELVFKPTVEGDNSWNGLFGGSLGQGGYWMFHSVGNLSYYEGHSTATGTKITYRPWTKSNTFTTNQYHHLTICYTPTSSTKGKFDLYYNGGEKVDSFNWTFNWSYSLDMQTIGNGGGNRYGTNDIHYFKQYSKTLTADEVAQNFKSVKSRFNI